MPASDCFVAHTTSLQGHTSGGFCTWPLPFPSYDTRELLISGPPPLSASTWATMCGGESCESCRTNPVCAGLVSPGQLFSGSMRRLEVPLRPGPPPPPRGRRGGAGPKTDCVNQSWTGSIAGRFSSPRRREHYNAVAFMNPAPPRGKKPARCGT